VGKFSHRDAWNRRQERQEKKRQADYVASALENREAQEAAGRVIRQVFDTALTQESERAFGRKTDDNVVAPVIIAGAEHAKSSVGFNQCLCSGVVGACAVPPGVGMTATDAMAADLGEAETILCALLGKPGIATVPPGVGMAVMAAAMRRHGGSSVLASQELDPEDLLKRIRESEAGDG